MWPRDNDANEPSRPDGDRPGPDLLPDTAANWDEPDWRGLTSLAKMPGHVEVDRAVGLAVSSASWAVSRQGDMLWPMEPGKWTVQDHLRDKPPAVIALYQRFVELVEACGPSDCSVSRTAVTFKGSRRGFAGARPTSRSLDGYLDLQRARRRVRRLAPRGLRGRPGRPSRGTGPPLAPLAPPAAPVSAGADAVHALREVDQPAELPGIRLRLDPDESALRPPAGPAAVAVHRGGAAALAGEVAVPGQGRGARPPSR